MTEQFWNKVFWLIRSRSLDYSRENTKIGERKCIVPAWSRRSNSRTEKTAVTSAILRCKPPEEGVLVVVVHIAENWWKNSTTESRNSERVDSVNNTFRNESLVKKEQMTKWGERGDESTCVYDTSKKWKTKEYLKHYSIGIKYLFKKKASEKSHQTTNITVEE